jgi:hypothetical protein
MQVDAWRGVVRERKPECSREAAPEGVVKRGHTKPEGVTKTSEKVRKNPLQNVKNVVTY